MPTDPRSRVLQVRLTAGEVEALRTLAAAANMKPSEWTRALFAPLLIFEMSKASNAVTVPCVPLLDLHVSPTDPLPIPLPIRVDPTAQIMAEAALAEGLQRRYTRQ